MRMFIGLLIPSVLFFSSCSTHDSLQPPKHTILFILDGMACGTLEKIDTPTLQQLEEAGVYYPEVHLILPAHLERNDEVNDPHYYPWGCSLPNIPLMTGTIFVGMDGLKENMVQHSFEDFPTAFIANDDAYEELRYGFNVYYRYGSEQIDQVDYSGVIEKSKEIFTTENPRFIRIHMQGTGSAGYFDYNAGTNIWAENSLYRREIMRADSVLGYFIEWLKETGRWDETVMIVMGDHGQNDEGWHAPYVGQAQKQPVLIVGKGIKKGRVFEYAEAIDISPTIAYINHVDQPAHSLGRVLKEIFTGESEKLEIKQNIKQLNRLLLEHHSLLSDYSSGPGNIEFEALNKEFLTIETIGSWHQRFRTLDDLVEHESEILLGLRDLFPEK